MLRPGKACAANGASSPGTASVSNTQSDRTPAAASGSPAPAPEPAQTRAAGALPHCIRFKSDTPGECSAIQSSLSTTELAKAVADTEQVWAVVSDAGHFLVDKSPPLFLLPKNVDLQPSSVPLQPSSVGLQLPSGAVEVPCNCVPKY